MTDTAEPTGEQPQDEAPKDLSAPTRHTLPSGKVVECVAARTLLGADMAAAWAAQPGGGFAANVTAMRAALIARMVTEIEPGRRSKTPLDGTVEALGGQQPDDWKALYMLGPVTDAMGLLQGVSIIADMDAWQDPKALTPDASGPSPN